MAGPARIEPLNGENYDTWKLQTRAILIKNDLWGYASGTTIRPTMISTNAAEITEWETNDAKACADIMLAMSPSELGQVKEGDKSREIWLKLQGTYQSKGPARKATLLKKAALSRMREGDKVREHLNEFFDAVSKLREIGVEIGNDLLAILLLYSLPESYDTFRCALEAQDEIPEPSKLRVKILEEYESRKAKEDRAEHDVMYAKRSRNQNSHEQRQQTRGENYAGREGQHTRSEQRRQTECNRCGKHGHIAKYCRSKYPTNTQQSARQVEEEDDNVSVKSYCSQNQVLNVTETVMSNPEHDEKINWCLDSGCTAHMSADINSFENMTRMSRTLNLANNESTDISSAGNVKLPVIVEGREKTMNVENVLYVSDLRTNLLSVSKITDKGYEVIFRRKDAVVMDKGKGVVVRAERVGNLYYVKKCVDSVNVVEANIGTQSEIDKWHCRMGHLNERDLKAMAESGVVYGLETKSDGKLSTCEVCIREKQTRNSFPKSEGQRTSELLEIVHSDVCDPMRHPSRGEARYFVTFIDDNSRWCETYMIKQKSEVLRVFQTYKAAAETFTGKKIKALQSDNGREYCNREFDAFLQEQGIKRRLTVPHTPQQNGLAERKNRTLVEMARCMMRQAKVPPTFWAEAINTANYIRNRCITKSLDGKVPHTAWTGKKPTLVHLRTFGTKAYVLNKEQTKGKFDSRSYECMLVGYSSESKAYQLWSPKSRKLIVSRDVKFVDELCFQNKYDSFFEESEVDKQGGFWTTAC